MFDDAHSQLRQFADAFPFLLAYVDSSFRYRFGNKAYRDWFGISPSDLVGKHIRDVVGQETFDERLPHITTALNGKTVHFEGKLAGQLGTLPETETYYIPDFAESESDADGRRPIRGFYVLVQDITSRTNIQRDLNEGLARLQIAEERLRLATESANIGTWDLDPVTDTLFWDARCRAAFGYPLDLPIDYDTCFTLIHPDDRDSTNAAVMAALEPSGSGEYAVEFRTIGYVDGRERWARVEGKAIFDAAHETAIRFVGTIRDITEQKRIEESLREQSEFLRRVLESSQDCIKTLDLEGNLVAMTRAGQLVMEVDNFETLCGTAWPTLWEEAMRADVRTAIATAQAGGTGRFQGMGRTLKGTEKWWDVIVTPILGADGVPEQLLAVSRDITDQKQTEVRERARLTDIFNQAPAFMAALRGPEHVFEMVNPPFCSLVGIGDLVGRRIADVLPEVVSQGVVALLDTVYQTGEPFVGRDVSVLLQSQGAAPMEERVLDLAYQPLYDQEGAISGVLVHGIDLTDRKRLEREREALLAETRVRAEREALINEISAAIRAALDPEEVQARAVALLGQALDLDRCYFAIFDPNRPLARIARDWHRPDLRPLSGTMSLPNAPEVREEMREMRERTTIYNDVRETSLSEASKAFLEDFGLRSLIGFIVHDGDGVPLASLRAGMADAHRIWTADEIALIESVATLIQSSVTLANARRRERTIAHQLQDALMPPPPNDLPGLSLASYYRPALEEAGVGGDFFDVFAVEKGCTALVVADLSGKGLQAASQVATVRNMLRFAVYNGRTLSEAIISLHRTLVEHDLLTGFATLFIGMYDDRERTLTYVNCGQEPGLIWRASNGTVDHLQPTGSVLGGFIADDCTEATVTLARGDVLAFFTDGLTEVGPSRRELLEVEGVAGFLTRACAGTMPATVVNNPHAVVESLIGNVDAFARGGVGDDIALLVGVVGPTPGWGQSGD